jgi:hypothetical protein
MHDRRVPGVRLTLINSFKDRNAIFRIATAVADASRRLT